MSEIEVRILNIDVEKLKEKFSELGAKLVKKENQMNNIFDFPDNRLLDNHKGYCRIREVENLLDGSKKNILTVKKVKSQSGARESVEEETIVPDYMEMRRILEELGLVLKHSSFKYRESYELKGVLYEIDEWEKELFPQPYLEIEAPDQETLKKGIEMIGYTIDDTSTLTLRELTLQMEFKPLY